MTGTDDVQPGLFRDPQLESEYTRHWESNGFSWDAFLKWRTIPRSARTGPSYIAVLDVVLKDPQLDLYGIRDDGYMTDPEWANRWADYFPDIGKALDWSTLTSDPSDAAEMVRLGYRAPHRAEDMYRVIQNNRWMPLLKSRHDIKIPILDPSRVRHTRPGRDWPGKVIALMLNPTFRFSQKQIDAVSEIVDINQTHSDALGEITNTLIMISQRGWEIPDGDGVFSFLVNAALISSGTSLISSAAKMVVQAGDSRDDFISMVKLVKDDPRVTPEDIGRALYSVRTGVPYDWVDKELGAAVIRGKVEESGWEPTRTRGYSAGVDPLKFLMDDANREAGRL